MSVSEYGPFQQSQQYGNQGWGQGGGHGFGYGYGAGLGQAAFGQQNYGGIGGWQQGQWGGPWQRQLSQHDVGEVVRQLIPLLPQILGHAQQQPYAASAYGGFGQGGFGQGGFGQGGWGGGFGQGQRYLSQQDVNEVVRQILPVLPQIVSLLQGQGQGQGHANAIYGGLGGFGLGGFGLGGQQGGWGHQQGGWGGQQGWGQQHPFGQAAFGNNAGWGAQRQLSQVEVGEIVRHLTAALPQVIANLQAFVQQQQQRGA